MTSSHLAAAVLAAALVLAGCTSQDKVDATPVVATQQPTSQSAPASQAVPSSAAPASTTSTSAAPTSSAPRTTTAAPSKSSTTTADTGGLRGRPVDPTTGPRTKDFGQVTTWADKTAIRISQPVPFTPSTGGGGQYVVLTVTVHNGAPAAQPLEFWYFAATLDGNPVESVTDPAQGVGLPTGMLAAGAERTFKLAYPKTSAQKLVLQVTWRDGFPFTYQA
ncbi:hypothetical protein ACQB6R_09945 [Propionibacteriaceae bacterium G1746]|uniref:hypothetical protein n=1 Tax=Aestuariimicrobium sp. G57 TaxID=3418485 RepID=UPI003C24927E